MGLKRWHQNDATLYMYFNISSSGQGGGGHTLEAVILAEDNPSTVKVTTSNDDVQRWCVKLGRSAEEYLEQLCDAVLTEDTNAGVFEVQGDHLVWKQYFPDKDIYGKKGKFKMEKMEYKEAVQQVLAGLMTDLHNSSRQIHRLTQETHNNIRELNEAQELACKSVQMKVDFEKEIYSKCAALINAKKLRIHQLRSTHPSSSAAGRSSCLVRSGDEAGTTTPPAKKPRKQEAEISDGYSSDTDVDDPDEDTDTDEERAVSLSPAKPSREGRMTTTTTTTTRQGKGQDQGQVSSKSKAFDMPDSQDLFNASLEAELFPSSAAGVQRGADSAALPAKPDVQSPPQLTRSKAAEPIPSSSLDTSKGDYDDDTQMSILNTLF